MLRRALARLTPVAVASSGLACGNLTGLKVSVFMENSESAATDLPVATGKITAQLSTGVYAVTFQEMSLSPVIEVGTRVYVTKASQQLPAVDAASRTSTQQQQQQPDAAAAKQTSAASTPSTLGSKAESGNNAPAVVAGLVAKVNGDGTFGVLLDNDKFESAVPRDFIALSEGRSKLLTNEKYDDVLQWVKSAGVDKRSDQESTSCILFSRGWRADKLYLLDHHDVNCLSHLSKSVRVSLLEKADWEREHQRQRRDMSKERLKEKDFRYVLTKYSSVFSACVAVFTAGSVFTWNFKNWRKGLRSTQVELAVDALVQDATKPRVDSGKCEVSRSGELERLCQLIRRLDVQHPRVVVLTGSNGAGKSHLCRSAVFKEQIASVAVDIRGSEDPLRAVVKALGVQNVEVCGDLLDFLSEVCAKAQERLGPSSNRVVPLIVFKLREGNLQRVYNEALVLACDRRLCHVMIEIPIENITIATSQLPRLDFYLVPNFSTQEAFEYTQHLIDPIELLYFVDVVGTNSNDLDELIANVVQRGASGTEYTNKKLIKAMRHLSQSAKDPALREAIFKLACYDYDVGQRESHDLRLKHDALKDLTFYNAVADSWVFQNKLVHTAARMLMGNGDVASKSLSDSFIAPLSPSLMRAPAVSIGAPPISADIPARAKTEVPSA